MEGFKVRSFEDYYSEKNRHGAYVKAHSLRKNPCRHCGLFGCICQLSLMEWLSVAPKKEVGVNAGLDRDQEEACADR